VRLSAVNPVDCRELLCFCAHGEVAVDGVLVRKCYSLLYEVFDRELKLTTHLRVAQFHIRVLCRQHFELLEHRSVPFDALISVENRLAHSLNRVGLIQVDRAAALVDRFDEWVRLGWYRVFRSELDCVSCQAWFPHLAVFLPQLCLHKTEHTFSRKFEVAFVLISPFT